MLHLALAAFALVAANTPTPSPQAGTASDSGNLPSAAPAASRLDEDSAPAPVAPPATQPAAQPTPPKAPRKTSLAVLDFNLSGSLAPALARAFADQAALQAGKLDLQVLAQSEIAALLGFEKQKALLGCDDSSCFSEIVGALDVDRLLVGSASLIESTTVLNIRLLDARKGKPIARTNQNLTRASEVELLDAVRRLTHEAITGQKLDTTGRVRIEVDRGGAEVSIDGKKIGLSPVAAAQQLIEGRHEVVVQKDGFVRWASTIEVKAGADIPVSVSLIPLAAISGARSKLWTFGWVSTGVAVAALAVGASFGYAADAAYQDYEAASTRVSALDAKGATESRALVANVGYGAAGVAGAAAIGLLVGALLSDADVGISSVPANAQASAGGNAP